MYQQSMFLVKIASYCMGNMINIGLHNDSILLNLGPKILCPRLND